MSQTDVIFAEESRASEDDSEQFVSKFITDPLVPIMSRDLENPSVSDTGMIWMTGFLKSISGEHTSLSEAEEWFTEKMLLGAGEPSTNAAISLLESWRNGDSEEQRDTLEYLKRALDEDRPSDRKLFS